MPGLGSRPLAAKLTRIQELARLQYEISVTEVRELIQLCKSVFDELMGAAGHDPASVRALTTKFRDAGRRSAPWRATSARVPGRPQDGANGNRINRWMLPADHKFYAGEVTATLTEVKFYLQALSMNGAPPLPPNTIQRAFGWLLEHDIVPGAHLDPIQLVRVDIHDVLANPRLVQSGHLVPLDRGGQHVPANTCLLLASSNALQGNMTVDELLTLMREVIARHDARRAG